MTAHDLYFSTPALTWDEALPLGNGILGTLVWGDGQPLNISLDRTDLWDLRRVPEFSAPECSYQQLRQWVAEGRADEIGRMYDETYLRPTPTRLPAGRIQVYLADGAAFADATLRLHDALATVRWKEGTQAEVFLHAESCGLCGPSHLQPDFSSHCATLLRQQLNAYAR
jgi:alpha-L-fucosidase 2